MSTAAYAHRTSGSTASVSSITDGMLANGNGPGGLMPASNGATAVPAAAGAAPSGGGSRMAVIGVTRNVKLRRRGNAGFGFSLRGGREYSAGFYVSDVVPGGEAHAHGLRVGDQILRVNGYPVEDAIHQEVALLAKNQQVLVLKIRSVGMVPVKDNPNDPVTWHMVQQQQHQLQFGDAVSNEMRVRVVLGEKGRLGCGVCKGLVPGLTVQGTREGGPARAAGLKAGDIITWCNGQSLTDLPFERAIETMRNSAVLDLVVNRPIVHAGSNGQQHVYDSPDVLYGLPPRAAGYDTDSMSSSYHAGTSSPRRNAMLDPRMTQTLSRNRNCCPPSSGPADWGHMEQSQEWTRKPNNTTIIRISQSASNHQQQHHHAGAGVYGTTTTPQHQLYHHQQHQRRNSAPIPARPTRAGGGAPSGSYDDDDMMMMEEPIYDPVAPVRDYECHDFDANPREEVVRRAEFRREHGIREAGYELLTNEESDFGKENGATSSASVSPISSTGTSSSSCGSVTFNTLKRPTTSSSNNSNNSAEKEQQQLQPQQTQQQLLLLQQQQQQQQRKQVTTVEVHQPCPPAPPQPQQQPYKWPAETKPMNAMGMQMGSTMSMGSTGSTETESSLESSCGKDSASTSSSLSTSSSCEHQQSSGTLSFANSIAAAAAAGAKSMDAGSSCNTIRHRPSAIGPVKVPPPPPPPIDLGSAITQELQRRAKQRSMNNATGQDQQQQGGGAQEARKPQNPEALRAQEQKVTHDKLMEEFKRAHQRMFNAQRSQNADQNAEQDKENPSTTEDSSKTSQEINQATLTTTTSAPNNVDKLATALNNKVTIRINPEATNR